MKALISSIDALLAKVDNGTISLQELELVVDDARELYERLVVLRYKVYEEGVLGTRPSVVEAEVEMAPVEAAPIQEETTNSEETSFEFDLFASETPAPEAPIAEAVSEVIEMEVEAPAFDLAPEPSVEAPVNNEWQAEETTAQEEELTIEEEELPIVEEHHSVSHSEEEVDGTVYETVTEHHELEEQTENTHSFTEETIVTSAPIQEVAPQVEEVVEKPSISFGNSHPLAPGLLQIARNVRSKSNVIPLESLVGSFTLNEKLLFINELFGGSSDNFSNAVKKLDNQHNLSVAMEAMAEMAASYGWDMESETIEEFMHKICRRYALAGA